MHHYTVNIIITLIKLINHYVCEELTRLYVQQNATSRQDDDKTTVITMC